MSRGKYNPVWVKKECVCNCYGEVPATWTTAMAKVGDVYEEKQYLVTMIMVSTLMLTPVSIMMIVTVCIGSGVDRNGLPLYG